MIEFRSDLSGLLAMMWQVTSGSYYNRINEVIPYSYYLEKAQACAAACADDLIDPLIAEHLVYIGDIERVRMQLGTRMHLLTLPLFRISIGLLQIIPTIRTSLLLARELYGISSGPFLGAIHISDIAKAW